MRKLMQRLSGYHRLRWALLAAWLPAFLGMGLIFSGWAGDVSAKLFNRAQGYSLAWEAEHWARSPASYLMFEHTILNIRPWDQDVIEELGKRLPGSAWLGLIVSAGSVILAQRPATAAQLKWTPWYYRWPLILALGGAAYVLLMILYLVSIGQPLESLLPKYVLKQLDEDGWICRALGTPGLLVPILGLLLEMALFRRGRLPRFLHTARLTEWVLLAGLGINIIFAYMLMKDPEFNSVNYYHFHRHLHWWNVSAFTWNQWITLFLWLDLALWLGLTSLTFAAFRWPVARQRIAQGFMICDACGYDLRGTFAVGRTICPECGQAAPGKAG